MPETTGERMSWSTLLERVSERSGRPMDEVKEILEAFVEVSLEALSEGNDVPIRGLGTLGSRWLEPRSLRSVHDSRRLMLDGRWVSRFRASSRVRDALLSRTPQRWRDPRHQAAWRLAEALVGDLDLYHGDRAPKLDEQTPLPMVASICAVAFGSVWERVVQTWNAQVPPGIRAEGQHLLRVAHDRWRTRAH